MGFVKRVKKEDKSKPQIKAQLQKRQEIKPNFEGSYFTNAYNNLAQVWYVGCQRLQHKNHSICK